jgi:hypothetical protein
MYNVGSPSGNAHAKVYGADGSVIRDSFSVSATGSAVYATIAGLKGGGFVTAFRESPGSSVRVRLFDNDGTPLSGNLFVSTAPNVLDLDVAALASGGFALASYDASLGISVQLFDNWANKVGGPIQGGFGSQTSNVAIAGLQFGGFVLTWTQNDQAGDVRAQIYDATGAPVGASFLVDPVTAGTQHDAEITAFSWGGFAVTWTSTGPRGADTSGTATMLQVFDSMGRRVGDTVAATDRTLGNQSAPVLATLSGDRFVLGWTRADRSRSR